MAPRSGVGAGSTVVMVVMSCDLPFWLGATSIGLKGRRPHLRISLCLGAARVHPVQTSVANVDTEASRRRRRSRTDAPPSAGMPGPMKGPMRPPIEPMLERLVRKLPEGDLTYEPKWDGFRCLVFVDEDDIDLRSRHDRPLARYFPELVSAVDVIPARRPGAPRERGWVMDGEVLLAIPGDFSLLMSRLHPAASRVERLARETPAGYVAFDLLADGSCDGERRWRCPPSLPEPRHARTTVPAPRPGTLRSREGWRNCLIVATW